MHINLIKIDYLNPEHQAHLLYLLNHYAEDAMGGGKPLSNYAKENLTTELAKRPNAFTFIAYADGKPAGIANCFEGFSTFASKPLINIHDLAVHTDFRGKGISKMLMQAVSDEGKKRQCCKITLEVLTGNKIAFNAYLKFGFKPYELKPENGSATFMELYL